MPCRICLASLPKGLHTVLKLTVRQQNIYTVNSSRHVLQQPIPTFQNVTLYRNRFAWVLFQSAWKFSFQSRIYAITFFALLGHIINTRSFKINNLCWNIFLGSICFRCDFHQILCVSPAWLHSHGFSSTFFHLVYGDCSTCSGRSCILTRKCSYDTQKNSQSCFDGYGKL